jgi:hypothetical protein
LSLGDKPAAKLAIAAMHRLTRGYDSDDMTHELEGQTIRLAKTGELSIVHTGRNFIVRETKHKQVVEVGR